MKTKTIANALVCVSLLAGAAAQAQGLVVGGSLGTSRYKGDDVGGATTDKSDTGGKLYGGYAFNPNFSVEAGYASLGKFQSPAGEAKGDGVFVDAVGTFPLGNNFSLLGRVGAFNGKLDNTAVGASERGTNLKVGAGVQYDFDKNLGLRGEWERYRFDATGGTNANTDLYSVGLNYKF
jgi:OOP family OmpA-OmpF porin